MRRTTAFFVPLLILLLAACGPAVDNTVSPTEEGEIAPGRAMPATTPGGENSGEDTAAEAYPLQPTTPPRATREPGYPGATAVPTRDPYPAGPVWIIRPVGVQCEEDTAPGYGSLEEAVATLEEAGVTVLDADITDIPMADVCGGPTSSHYRVQIDSADMALVIARGWSREP